MYYQKYPRHVHQTGHYPNQVNPYGYQSYDNYGQVNPAYSPYDYRQQTIQGQATWTEGGPVTQCGIPWSHNEYMTAAVGGDTPYQCGQALKIKYPNTQREVIVTIVDRVQDYPPNKVNLHRRAFEALGANPNIGIINVEISPTPELEEERWGKYLLGVTQTTYPAYRVTDYNFIERTEQSPTQTKEVYEFILQSPQERLIVQGTVIYNPQTDRIISFDIKET